jgi:hypothetical protein
MDSPHVHLRLGIVYIVGCTGHPAHVFMDIEISACLDNDRPIFVKIPRTC